MLETATDYLKAYNSILWKVLLVELAISYYIIVLLYCYWTRMPFHDGWMPREGFTYDAVAPYIKNTVLNPALTLPALLFTLFAAPGIEFADHHPLVVSRLRILVYVGVARVVNGILNQRALNCGVSDKYDWMGREVVVCTGGSDGIGRGIVLLLAEKGVKVAVLDIQPLTYEAPSTVGFYKCDIRSPGAIAKAAGEIRSRFGEATVLINNAGVVRGKTVLEGSEADVRLTFDVNSLSHYWLAKEFLPNMIKENHGMIVTVSSMAAFVATANMVDYASSKAAAMAFHEGIASELVTRYKAPKVRTVLVNQSYTRTSLFKGWKPDKNFLTPILEPETVAEGVVKQVLKGESGHLIMPRSLVFIGPMVRVLPYYIANGMRDKMEQAMRTFSGRQVIQPEKSNGEGQA